MVPQRGQQRIVFEPRGVAPPGFNRTADFAKRSLGIPHDKICNGQIVGEPGEISFPDPSLAVTIDP